MIGCMFDLEPPHTQTTTPTTTHEDVRLETAQQEVVYGEDDRQDVYEVEDPALEQLARRSIMAMISSRSITIDQDGSVSLRAGTLDQRYGLCSNQRYQEQITAASCSATLIDDDLIVTAGHCVETQAECESQKWVLGYLMEDESQLGPMNSADVFGCGQLVLSLNTNTLDYAFIRLDRAVDPLRGEPAPVSARVDALALGEPLVMMGFPSGLPLKVEAGGAVSDPRNTGALLNYFKATVDAFGGNSGSGVFDAQGEQVGILVRGETDYVPSGRCTIVNELSASRGPGDDAEEITYLSRAIRALCESGYPSERLCQSTQRGLCFECNTDEECRDGFVCGSFPQYPEAPTFCAPPCDDEGLCPEGHGCLMGQCTPIEDRSCDADRVIAIDSCGRALGVVEECGEGLYCRRGACLISERGDQCETSLPLQLRDQVIQGSFQEGFTDTANGSCGGNGPEVFYSLTLNQPNHLVATAEGFDTVLYLRSSCSREDEMICIDDSRPPGRYGSQIDVQLGEGTYFLSLDSYAQDERGDFTLNIDLCDEICTRGETRCVVEGTAQIERCDVDQDGCVRWLADRACEGGQVCRQGSCAQQLPGETCNSAFQLDLSSGVASIEWQPFSPLNTQGYCVSNILDGVTADTIFTFDLTYQARLSVELNGAGSRGVVLRSSCALEGEPDREILCADDDQVFQSQTPRLDPGEYSLIVFNDESADELLLTVSATPLCEDQCSLDTPPICVEVELEGGLVVEGVKQCVMGGDGCTLLELVEVCTDQVCAGGSCQEECFDVCVSGEQVCIDDQSPIACVADERGCLAWRELELCAEGDVCAGEGVCVPRESDWGMMGGDEMVDEGTPLEDFGVVPNPPPVTWSGFSGPKEVEITPRSRGGCQAFSQGSEGYSPILISLLILILKRRRRGVGFTN